MNRDAKFKSMVLLIALVILILVGGFFSSTRIKASEEDEASNRTLVEERGARATPPIGQAIRNVEEWNAAMASTTEVDYYLDTPLLTLTTTATVTTNKRIDLNGNTLLFSGNSGKLLLNGRPEIFTDFTIFSSSGQGRIESSGHTTGTYRGPIYDGRADNLTAPNVAADQRNLDLIVTFKDIDVSSDDEFVYLFLAKEVVFKGTINIDTAAKGVVATNITIYGNEKDPNDPENANVTSTTRQGTGNPTEYASGFGPLNFALAPNYGTSAGWDRRSSEEILFQVQKNAKLNAENNGTNATRDLPYQNVIANYRHFENRGETNITTRNRSAALRTITSAGTNAQSPHASIRLLEGSKTRISTLNAAAFWGAIFSYKMNFEVESPEIFDIRYFGSRQFIFAWASGSNSSLAVKNMNHAVWSQASEGIGNPLDIWEEVTDFSITNLQTTDRGTVTSSNTDMAANFNFNNYSRWSNDIELPVLVPDSQLPLVAASYEVPNGVGVGLLGSTDYRLPGNLLTGKPVANATVTLTLGSGGVGNVYTTMTGEDGLWDFSPVDFSIYPGGTIGKVNLVDSDLRTDEISIKIIDTLPPAASPKLLSTVVGSVSGIPIDPRLALSYYSDETTPINQLEVSWVTTDIEKEDIVQTPGMKSLQVSVKDIAGNETIVDVPIGVTREGAVTTDDGSVNGNSFSMYLSEWSGLSDAEKRAVVIEKGNATGHEISGINVTNVTNDPSKFIVDVSSVGSTENTLYPITLTVGTATKTIYINFDEQDSILTVEFTNELNEVLPGYTITIAGLIGDTIDLTQEAQVVTQLTELENAGFEIAERPTNESAVVLDNTAVTVQYKLQGMLSLASTPTTFDFGSLTYNATTKRVENPQIDQPLIVADTRAEASAGWVLTATLSTPMSNDNGQELVDALRYVYNGEETILNANAQTVYMNTSGTSGRFDLSNDWGSQAGSDGVKLQIGSSDIVYTGTYVGVITWKVMAGQP